MTDDHDRGYEDGYQRASELHASDENMLENMLGSLGDWLDEGANAFESEEFKEGFRAGKQAYIDSIR